MIKEFDGRTIVGATMRLVGAGDGLSQAQKLKGELPNYQIGDRTVVVHEVELIKIGVEPATKDDLDGDLNVVLTWRALNGLPTDAPAVRKLLQQHSKRLAEAKELEGQQKLLDEDDDDQALEDKEKRLAAAEANGKKTSKAKTSRDDWGDDD